MRSEAMSTHLKWARAAIFDLDGVIVSTSRYHYLAWRKVAAELDFEFSEAQNERLKGVSRMQSLNLLLDLGGMTLDDGIKKELASKKNAWYQEYVATLDESAIVPGALELLITLRQLGVKIALGSASQNTPLIVERLKLVDYFDTICDGNVVSRAKPDPEVFLVAAQRLSVPPHQCVVFEDAVEGVRAAKAGGMFAVGVGDCEVLKDADLVVARLCDFDAHSLF